MALSAAGPSSGSNNGAKSSVKPNDRDNGNRRPQFLIKDIGSVEFEWTKPADTVYVTGTFDDWKVSHELRKIDGVFRKRVRIDNVQDDILYKFVVDGEWVHDENQPVNKSGGNINNVLRSDMIKILPAFVKGDDNESPAEEPESLKPADPETAAATEDPEALEPADPETAATTDASSNETTAATGTRGDEPFGITSALFEKAMQMVPGPNKEIFSAGEAFDKIIQPRHSDLLKNILERFPEGMATTTQKVTIESYYEKGDLSNARFLAPFGCGKTMTVLIPLLCRLLDMKEQLRSTIFTKPALLEKFGYPASMHNNILGPSCYAIIVCMSHNLALQTVRELEALTKDLGISVLLCRKFPDNSPVGNLQDIAHGRGHIVVATMGRLASMHFKEMTSFNAGPRARRALKEGDLQARNAILHSNVFASVQALVIDEATFVFDTSKDGKTDDIEAIRQLTTMFADDWKIQMIRAVLPEQLRTLPVDSETDDFDSATFFKARGSSNDSNDVTDANVFMPDDWYYMPEGNGLPTTFYDLTTVTALSMLIPKLTWHMMGEEETSDADLYAPYWNELGHIVAKSIPFAQDGKGKARADMGRPGKTVVIVQSRKAVYQVAAFLNANSKLANTRAEAVEFSSDVPQRTRDENEAAFRDKDSNVAVLVSTSALIRGMNFEADAFILAQIPKVDAENEIARSLALEDVLTSIARAGRLSKDDHACIIFGRKDALIAYALRIYFTFVALPVDPDTPSEFWDWVGDMFDNAGIN